MRRARDRGERFAVQPDVQRRLPSIVRTARPAPFQCAGLLIAIALWVGLGVAATDSMSLWQDGPHLRGANLWQRIVVPSLDGTEFLGNARVGPPVKQEDFNQLAGLGANLVILSHPGLFTERPPYQLDRPVQANLDRLIDMATRAGLYVVIALRTGPGRSDFTFYRDGAGDWFDPKLLIETVWTSPAAQDGWIRMWQHVATRYRDRPGVVGYELMVEPNGADVTYDICDPTDFYPRFANALADWNAFYPRIAAAVRHVDSITPILVGPMGWSSIDWLPYLEPIDDPRIVYAVHQYEPQSEYTHQNPDGAHRYPGRMDLDEDGQPEYFDRAWLTERIQSVASFREAYEVPMAVTEYGIKRWIPGAAGFMADQMAQFEHLGMNHALWAFAPRWPPLVEIDAFDFLHGPDPHNHFDTESDLLDTIQAVWARNRRRPPVD